MPERNLYRRDVASTKADLPRIFAAHTCEEAISRSFLFQGYPTQKQVKQLREGDYPFAKVAVSEKARFVRSSPYWFRLTWTPGHLALTGDLGDLTLNHGHAMRRFGDIGWALSPDHEYLMSKTETSRVYDAGETLAFVLRHLNEPVVLAFNGYNGFGRPQPGLRQELNQYRREKAWNDRMFDEVALLHAAVGAEPPDWDEFDVGEPPEGDAAGWSRKRDWRERWGALARDPSMGDFWTTPDHWHGWVEVWRKLHGIGYDPRYIAESPDFVRLARNRRELKDEIEEELESAERAAEFLSSIGFSDYYGSYVWPLHSYMQIGAIQHGVRMILAREFPCTGHGQQREAAHG